MALTLNPRESAYQIQMTPYFRRLHRKDSEELERLKQAYDHFRNFDEKPIVAQVKNIRLGKLIRRIKDSLNSVKAKRANKTRSKPKTKDQIRREELAKARQIGIEYSRQNFGSQCQSARAKESYKREKEWEEKRSRLECRIKYGNEKSQENRAVLQRSCGSISPRSMDGPFKDRKEPPMVNHLKKLQKSLPKREFMKYIFHCLSAERPDPNIISTIEEILQSDPDFYWDIQRALERRRQHIAQCSRTIQRLFKIASKCAPTKPLYPSEAFVESFNSTTYFKPSRREPSEIYIRTYRYSDGKEELPLPSESFLKLTDDMLDNPAQNIYPTIKRVFNCATKNFGINPTVTNKFDSIIRQTVRKESEAMLADLENALRH